MAQRGLIDPNLERTIRRFVAIKDEARQKRAVSEAVPWTRPQSDEWDGDLRTEEGQIALHRAFNTDVAEEALIQTCSPGNGEQPGNVGDVVVLSLQIDYAAQAERAYRARSLQSFPRMLAHLTAREKGHSQPHGALQGQALNYFTVLLKQSAESEGGAV